VHGADRVARFLLGITAKAGDEEIRVVSVNSALGIGLFREDVLSGVVSLTVERGLISRIDFVRAPSKLRRSTT
jgi:RNA polymerase sigma-70 factor (ECF subfamily)